MLLCEPNICEGRDPERIEALTRTVADEGVEVVHASADADHHRMVLAYRGAPDRVVAATTALVSRAAAEIDLRDHRGVHPRIGVVDVIPFVPLEGSSEEEALAACRAVGRWVGEAGIPVFYYEAAATAEHRRALPAIRSGQFEGLTEKMQRAEWAPDEGPDEPHPTAGALVVGVRGPLVRFNVNLETEDLEPARRIAARIRESGGGLPRVRALGLSLASRGLTQVSMNLTDFEVTGLAIVYDRIKTEAEALGVSLADAELIGPVPRRALEGVETEAMGLDVPDIQILDFISNAEGRSQ